MLIDKGQTTDLSLCTQGGRRRRGSGDALAGPLGTPASFGAFTPGIASPMERTVDGQRHLHRG